ncbi:hypothetical protein [Kordiimonas lacus]|uniref:Uncharacterized protein n=1 Tax=Kordiimonas lacus TaxID=637679 RepID=A0A1G7BI17_9PROT|nr:hypothetical protein [Kordiimonas lacus]SDE26527.1 hypothetical protein SAMN04488071_2521 [Kordiimonas lacus]
MDSALKGPELISLVTFGVLSLILLGFAGTVLYKIWVGKIDITQLLVGKTKASLSRFQFLIFTFVIAGLFLALSIEAGTFVDIPGNVLVLLGISGAGYAMGKSMSKPSGQNPPPAPDGDGK